MIEKPWCAMCGGDCLRLWDHFGEGEDPEAEGLDEVGEQVRGIKRASNNPTGADK